VSSPNIAQIEQRWGGWESARSVARTLPGELIVSKRKLRQAEGSCLVRLRREEGKQNVGFSSRPFVLCGLPVRKPRAGVADQSLSVERAPWAAIRNLEEQAEFSERLAARSRKKKRQRLAKRFGEKAEFSRTNDSQRYLKF
jgi:hypothetical protein